MDCTECTIRTNLLYRKRRHRYEGAMTPTSSTAGCSNKGVLSQRRLFGGSERLRAPDLKRELLRIFIEINEGSTLLRVRQKKTVQNFTVQDLTNLNFKLSPEPTRSIIFFKCCKWIK